MEKVKKKRKWNHLPTNKYRYLLKIQTNANIYTSIYFILH